MHVFCFYSGWILQQRPGKNESFVENLHKQPAASVKRQIFFVYLLLSDGSSRFWLFCLDGTADARFVPTPLARLLNCFVVAGSSSTWMNWFFAKRITRIPSWDVTISYIISWLLWNSLEKFFYDFPGLFSPKTTLGIVQKHGPFTQLYSPLC